MTMVLTVVTLCVLAFAYLLYDMLRVFLNRIRRKRFSDSICVGDVLVRYEHIDNPFLIENGDDVCKVVSIDYGRYSGEKFVKVENIYNGTSKVVRSSWMYEDGWRFYED